MKKYNIYFRKKDKRYEGRIYKGREKNGRRRFKYVFGRTRDEVCRKIDEIRSVRRFESCNKTFYQIFDEWYKSIKHNVKESTAANYFMKAQKHIIPFFMEKNIDSVTSSDIYSFIEQKKQIGLSTRYISDIVILMKSIFKYAMRIYHIFNPMNEVTLSHKKVAEIKLLDNDEQHKLQQYIAENQNNTTLGIALCMSTGIRIGELCALTWSDIDIQKRILTVRKTIQRIQTPTEERKTKVIITEPKSESSKRCIPIPECMVSFLEKFKSRCENYLISDNEKPVEPRTMQYRFSKILKNVKVPSVHFHSLRHIFASNCVKLGFDIKTLSEILGHSSVEITLNRYVHSSFEQKIEYMKRISFNF